MHKPSAISLATGLLLSGLHVLHRPPRPRPWMPAGLQAIDAAVTAVAPKMVNWRRDIHFHPT